MVVETLNIQIENAISNNICAENNPHRSFKYIEGENMKFPIFYIRIVKRIISRNYLTCKFSHLEEGANDLLISSMLNNTVSGTGVQ